MVSESVGCPAVSEIQWRRRRDVLRRQSVSQPSGIMRRRPEKLGRPTVERRTTSDNGCCAPQDITLTVVSERSVREVSLEEDTDEVSTVNVQSFVDEQEWRLYSNVETRTEVVTRVYQGDDCSHPSFSTLCHASRRFGFYFWNILFVMVTVYPATC